MSVCSVWQGSSLVSPVDCNLMYFVQRTVDTDMQRGGDGCLTEVFVSHNSLDAPWHRFSKPVELYCREYIISHGVFQWWWGSVPFQNATTNPPEVINWSNTYGSRLSLIIHIISILKKQEGKNTFCLFFNKMNNSSSTILSCPHNILLFKVSIVTQLYFVSQFSLLSVSINRTGHSMVLSDTDSL